MAALPLKPEYGPTLGQMLSPRWRRVPRVARALVWVAVVAFVGVVVAGVLRLEPATISYGGGPVNFHFSYKDMFRARPDVGGYVKVTRRSAKGVLEDSFAVEPLVLAPYGGGLSVELPLYASRYIRGLERRDSTFLLRGEGKTRVNTVPGYNVFYTTSIDGREVWGRDVLLLPERAGARDGVVISMLTSPTASSQVKTPVEVATAGVLQRALHTFTFS
jgi:hypothetical protein